MQKLKQKFTWPDKHCSVGTSNVYAISPEAKLPLFKARPSWKANIKIDLISLMVMTGFK